MTKRLILAIIITAALASLSSAFAQSPSTDQQRIVEPIIINGQQAQGVLVIQNGMVQGYSCPSPQPYITANQSESGWACFEQTTGTWLLHAQPPLQATAPQQQPTIIYSQPTAVYVPAPVYGYPYPYYPYRHRYYSYPYITGPRFGFSFGYRSPIIVNRPVVIGRTVVPFAGSRPFGGFRTGRRSGFGHVGRR